MNDELEKIIRSYKITLAVMCILIMFIVGIFSWVIVWHLPDLILTAVNTAFENNLESHE